MSRPYRDIDGCLRAFAESAKGESPDSWGVYVRVGTQSPFYVSMRNVCATSSSCDDGTCFVEPSSGNVLSPTTEEQRRSFPKFQYVGQICSRKISAKGKERLGVRLESSAGDFDTREHAALSFDEAVRKLPDAKDVEYGGLILNRGVRFYRTSLLRGTHSTSEVDYPDTSQVFADKDGSLWDVDTRVRCEFVLKGRQPESETEEGGSVYSVVGKRHSHPGKNDTAGFSGTDYDSYLAAGIPLYLSDSEEVLRLSETDEKSGDVMSIARTGDGGFSLTEKKYDEETRTKFIGGGEGTNVYLPDSAEGPSVYRNPAAEKGGFVLHAPVPAKEVFGKSNGSFFNQHN